MGKAYNSKVKKIVLISLGSLFVGLGVLGIFLPVLPTTPFLLLAAACYSRSSARFYHWLLNNKLFGKYIRNYREGKGIPVKTQILAISILWITILATVIFAVQNLVIRILLIGIAVGVTIHIIHRGRGKNEISGDKRESLPDCRRTG